MGKGHSLNSGRLHGGGGVIYENRQAIIFHMNLAIGVDYSNVRSLL